METQSTPYFPHRDSPLLRGYCTIVVENVELEIPTIRIRIFIRRGYHGCLALALGRRLHVLGQEETGPIVFADFRLSILKFLISGVWLSNGCAWLSFKMGVVKWVWPFLSAPSYLSIGDWLSITQSPLFGG